MELPSLSPEEIKKFDRLLLFLKQNENGFIDVMTYCTQQWGENYKLYYSFSNHLKINGLTIVSNYSDFSQTISQKGKAFKNFKKAYRIKKTNDLLTKFNKYFELISKPLLGLITLCSAIFGIYQYVNAIKSDKLLKEHRTAIDSLIKTIHYLRTESVNTTPLPNNWNKHKR